MIKGGNNVKKIIQEYFPELKNTSFKNSSLPQLSKWKKFHPKLYHHKIWDPKYFPVILKKLFASILTHHNSYARNGKIVLQNTNVFLSNQEFRTQPNYFSNVKTRKCIFFQTCNHLKNRNLRSLFSKKKNFFLSLSRERRSMPVWEWSHTEEKREG